MNINVDVLRSEFLNPNNKERFFFDKYGLVFGRSKFSATVKSVFINEYGKPEADRLARLRCTNVKLGYDTTRKEKTVEDYEREIENIYREMADNGYDQSGVDKVNQICVKIETLKLKKK